MNKKIGCKIVASTVIASMLIVPAYNVFAYTKDETVYTKTANDGSSYQTIVTDHIKNSDSLSELNDVSELTNIQNTNGDETYSQNGKTLVWKANGNDIYYQGNTDKELPITMKITYKLDGEEISAKDLAGKTGELEIDIEFTNNEKHTVVVNGKSVTMYTPFVIVSGAVFDNEKADNIEITNGKIINNGSKSIAVGLCMPGMQESLGIDSDKLEVPENITIKADAKDFEMGTILTYASPKLIDEDDIKGLDKLDDIFTDTDKLSDSSKQLVDGANQLNDGAQTLNSGMQSALSGAKLISSKVKSSTSSLKNDTSDALTQDQINSIGESASKQASAAITAQKTTIVKSADAGIEKNKEAIYTNMMNTAKQIAESTAIATAENTAKQSAAESAFETAKETAATTAYNTALATAKSTAETTALGIFATQNNTTPENLTKAIKAYPTTEPYKTLAAAITKAGSDAETTVKGQKSSIESTAVTNVKSQESAIKAEAASKATLTNEQKANIIKLADAGIEAQSATIKAGALASAKQIAESTATQTASTVASMVGNEVGKNVASQVANNVKSAALKEIASSMETLSSGLDELTKGMTELANGADSVKNGTQELADGMTKFDTEGIQKIVNLVNGDLKDFKARAEKLKDLANEYTTYSGNDENAETIVKFVTITDEIKKNDDLKENTTTPTTVDNSVAESPEKNENTTSNGK